MACQLKYGNKGWNLVKVSDSDYDVKKIANKRPL